MPLERSLSPSVVLFCVLLVLTPMTVALQTVDPGAGSTDPVESPQDTPPRPADPTGPRIVAHWKGGAIEQEKLDSWLRFQKSEPPTETQALFGEVEALLLVETLAQATLARSVAPESDLAFALEQAEESVLMAALRRHLARDIVVSQKRIEEQIRRQPELSHRPRKIRLRNLFKAFPPGIDEAGREALRQEVRVLLAELRNGADFAEMAKRESDSQTRFKGGLMGNVEPEKLHPEIAEIVTRLTPGQISHPIETEDGLTLLFCEAIYEEVKRTPEEVRQMVINHFTRHDEKMRWQTVQAELLAAAAPRFDFSAVAHAEASDAAVVARVDDRVLTLGQLRQLAVVRPGRRDVASLDAARLQSLAEGWVVKGSAAHRARELGLDDNPTLREQLSWQRLQLLAGNELDRRTLEAFVPLGEGEIRAYFEQNGKVFQHPPQYDVAMLRMEMPGGEERERYALAQELWRGLAQGQREFAATARQYSQHPSAAEGGALGWLSHRQLAQFGSRPMQVLTALAPEGGLGELVQHEGQLFVFELRGYRPAKTMTWEEAAGAAEQRLGNERLATLRARIEAELIATLEVRP